MCSSLFSFEGGRTSFPPQLIFDFYFFGSLLSISFTCPMSAPASGSAGLTKAPPASVMVAANPKAVAPAAPIAADPKAVPVAPAAPKAADPKTAAPARATAAALAPLGILPSGRPVTDSFQPSAAQLALVLTPHLRIRSDVSDVLPLPAGLTLIRSPDAVHNAQLRMAPFFARKMKRVFGYVAEILLIEGDGAASPAQLQVVIKIPWRYGSTSRETEASRMLTRLIAFTSKALFEDATRINMYTPFFNFRLRDVSGKGGVRPYQAGALRCRFSRTLEWRQQKCTAGRMGHLHY